MSEQLATVDLPEALDVLKDKILTRSQIDEIQRRGAQLPQVECPTDHYIANGMYCRKFHYKAGTFYVGRVHKTQHLFMVLKGESVVWTENGIVSLQQGDVYIGEPGTKRVLFAKTDGFWVTVQRTDKIDIKEMEEELMEPDDTSPFDAFNHLKNSVIELEKIS